MITHTIATIEDFLIMDGFSIDIKRTRICGIPKYPNPQPSPLTISCQLASKIPPPKAHCVTAPVAASVYSYTVVRAAGSNRSL